MEINKILHIIFFLLYLEVHIKGALVVGMIGEQVDKGIVLESVGADGLHEAEIDQKPPEECGLGVGQEGRPDAKGHLLILNAPMHINLLGSLAKGLLQGQVPEQGRAESRVEGAQLHIRKELVF
jgi:hypothetical protein